MKRIFIQLSGLIFCASANAQQAFNNSGSLKIYSGTSVSAFGDFTNTSTGVLINNGSLYVKGTITNDQSSMSPGTGTLYINGSAAQSVNGSQPVKTYNLISDNSAGITLNNDLSVSGAHTFTNGLITTSVTPNYLIYESGSSYSGSSDSRHVNGWVKKSGNTNFTFPVGNATYERAVAVSNLSAVSEIDCHYYAPTQNVFNLSSPLVRVKDNEYWQLNKISGGTAQIIMNWDHTKVPMDNILIADILAAQYSTGNWTSAGGSATGNVTTTGTVTSSAISTFGPVTLGYTSFPVPLKLISFTAERRNRTSFLTWVTENEENVDHFDVQRSYDAGVYVTIGNVPARNMTSTQVYNFEDHSALNGLAYYRIKSVDRDGKFSYSRIAVVSENDIQSANFYVLNPARSAITVFNKTGQEGQFDYKLFSAGGQLLLKGNVHMGVNEGAVLPLPSITATGLYVLELSNEKIKFRQKVLIEK